MMVSGQLVGIAASEKDFTTVNHKVREYADMKVGTAGHGTD